jgi:EpsD family peptidyl-prolyl cis-trans isomerase
MIGRSILPLALIAVAALAFHDLPGSRGHAGPVAAVVNGEIIPVHQVESAAAQATHAVQEQGKYAQARALQRIIDQELLAQEARKAGLDRDPRIEQAIQTATRQVLAQAWLEQAVSAAPAETREQVEKFYGENPALFQRRRLYRVLELAVISPPERVGEIQKAAAEADSIDEMAAWLASRRLPFNAATASKPAEQIPLEVLQEVYAMQPGQIAVFPTPRGASVVQLLRSSEAPLRKAEATPVIERYLHNRRRLALGMAEIRRLREQASIEYDAAFEPARASTPITPAAQAASRTMTGYTDRPAGLSKLSY